MTNYDDGLLGYTDIERDADKKLAKEKLERLRDEFAMAALNGFVSVNDYRLEDIPKLAYDLADSALKAREIK